MSVLMEKIVQKIVQKTAHIEFTRELYAGLAVISLTILLALARRWTPKPQSKLSTPNNTEIKVKVTKARLPAPDKYCVLCNDGPKESERGMLRCSSCKNQFYCSQDCQTKDWKTHKYNCSLLPAEGLREAEFKNRDALRDEAARVGALMKGWLDAAQQYKGKDEAESAKIPQALAIAEPKISDDFEYLHLPSSHKQYPFRTPLTLICRLFLMDFVAGLSSASRDNLAERLDSVQLPSHIPRIFGPKVVSRPGDLSPGEYETLGFVAMIPTTMNPVFGLDQTGIERWIALRLAHLWLWNAPRSK